MNTKETLGVGIGHSSPTSLKTQRCKPGSHNGGKCGSHHLSLIMGKLNSTSCFSAKLGDTKELEDFIADLDRTLASEYMHVLKNQTEN